jgi:Solute carrier family 12
MNAIKNFSMANLLSKFRIDYSDLIMIREITRKPQDSSKAFFKHLIQDLRAPKGIPVDDGTLILNFNQAQELLSR